MSVDTDEMRRLANELEECSMDSDYCGEFWPRHAADPMRCAAAEIDEIRQDKRRHLAQIEATAEATAVRYSQQIRDLRAAHEATKRELESARVAIASAYRDASGELTTALNANERLRADLTATNRELDELKRKGPSKYESNMLIEGLSDTQAKLEAERAAYEAAKRELDELRVSYDRGVASFAKMHTEALAERARRESAEATLAWYASDIQNHLPSIGAKARAYFARYPRDTEGT